jgi:hypothetical protein
MEMARWRGQEAIKPQKDMELATRDEHDSNWLLTTVCSEDPSDHFLSTSNRYQYQTDTSSEPIDRLRRPLAIARI